MGPAVDNAGNGGFKGQHVWMTETLKFNWRYLNPFCSCHSTFHGDHLFGKKLTFLPWRYHGIIELWHRRLAKHGTLLTIYSHSTVGPCNLTLSLKLPSTRSTKSVDFWRMHAIITDNRCLWTRDRFMNGLEQLLWNGPQVWSQEETKTSLCVWIWERNGTMGKRKQAP